MGGSLIAIEQRAMVDRCYRVLIHLDLGADAANIFQEARAFSEALLEAYRAAPNRLALHFVGLWAGDESETLRWLREGAVPALREGADKALALSFAEALEQTPAQTQPPDPDFERLLPSLEACRAALYGERRPPPLRILHAPALGRHGRAMGLRGERRVATSLAREPQQAFCQVLHEETHPLSDPRVGAAPRDTRLGTAGHAQHLRLEQAAVDLGGRVIDQAAPALAPAYAKWRARFHM